MKKTVFLLLALIALFTACNSGSAEQKTSSEPGSREINMDAVVMIDMDIEGMTCTGCENTIETGVSELPGIVSVEASHTDAKTRVKVDTSITSVEKISEVINSKGYKVIDAGPDTN